jgi:hypothetical protein
MVNRSDLAEVSLRLLLDAVVRTRAQHSIVLRRCPTGSPEAIRTRRAALGALEHYVSALRARDLPVPPKLQRDLTMWRNLCADPKSQRSR